MNGWGWAPRARRKICLVCQTGGQRYLCTAHRRRAARIEQQLAAGEPSEVAIRASDFEGPAHGLALRMCGFSRLADVVSAAGGAVL